MSEKVTCYCDGPECDHFWTLGIPGTGLTDFCGWGCVLTYAAQFPPGETYPMGEL